MNLLPGNMEKQSDLWQTSNKLNKIIFDYDYFNTFSPDVIEQGLCFLVNCLKGHKLQTLRTTVVEHHHYLKIQVCQRGGVVTP